MKRMAIIALMLITYCHLLAQSKINVTFRYYPSNAKVVRAFVPGSFNNWGPNNGGVIAANTPSQMTYVDSLGCYIKNYLLTVGETHYYKFHEHQNSSGSLWQWFTDPLNPLINTSDNNNSILQAKNAMIFQMSPKSATVVAESSPLLMAGVFVSQDDLLLLEESSLYVDGVRISSLLGHIVPGLSLLKFLLPSLSNGMHTATIRLSTRNGNFAADSTTFTVITGDVAFMTPSCDSIWASEKNLRWIINQEAQEISSIKLYQSGKSAVTIPVQSGKEYSRAVTVSRGENTFTVSIVKTSGQIFTSDTLKLRFPLPQKPQPQITLQKSGDKIAVTGTAIDPQRKSMTFLWSVQKTSPAPLPEVEGRSEAFFEINIPTIPGDYSLKLVVTDADGFSNSTVNFFTVRADRSVIIPNRETAPQWVRDSRIYCLFFKAYTKQGTFAAARQNLEHIKNMGFNTIWVLPVMDVEGVIDQGSNVGYNIIDFYHVDPVYGTDVDFKNFVARAHELGLRVILDVTPNHSSRSHPFALDARANKKYSRYYDFYQHEIISHETNGMGQSISSDGIVYYSGFTDGLLNWNWSDSEAQQYMIEVYRHWLREYDIDGFRLDVYWGPHGRYGKTKFDQPLRLALRATKADILLLGETNGTGTGTEENYADKGGGLDMGYDWIFKDAIVSYPAISELETKLYNNGYRPGSNSFYLRFLENQDEDRIAYRYNNIEKTLPVSAALFLATGIPLLYQGQEVGMGLGMSGSKDDRTRATVKWDNPPGRILAPHYQKLAQIRAQFPAFKRQMEDVNLDGQINSSDASMQPRLTASSNYIYAFGRPFTDHNGLVVINFANTSINFSLPLQLSQWALFTQGLQAKQNYYLNNLYSNTTQVVKGSELATLNQSLPAYGVAVYTISLSEDRLMLPQLTVAVLEDTPVQIPAQIQLFANYPNPFNACTRICFEIPAAAKVRLTVYDVLGREVKSLSEGWMMPGRHETVLNAMGLPSAVYFYCLEVAQENGSALLTTKKLLVMK